MTPHGPRPKADSRQREPWAYALTGKKSEKWNFMKTIVLTMFLRGWNIRNHQFFQSGVIKNRARNPHMLFDTSNRIKYEKVSQQCPNGAPRNHQKSTLGHSRAFLNAPLHHMITKLKPKWSPRIPKCSKNGLPRPLKINKCVCNPARKLIVTCFGDWLRIYLKTMGSSDDSMCANLWNPANPFNPASLANPANPSSLQITNLPLARGAGGMGEALR